MREVCKFVFDPRKYAQSLAKVNIEEMPDFKKMDYDIFDFSFSCRKNDNYEDTIFISIKDVLHFLNQVKGYNVSRFDIQEWRFRMRDIDPWITATIENQNNKRKIKSNSVHALYLNGMSGRDGEIGIQFSKEAFSAYLEFEAILSQ